MSGGNGMRSRGCVPEMYKTLIKLDYGSIAYGSASETTLAQLDVSSPGP